MSGNASADSNAMSNARCRVAAAGLGNEAISSPRPSRHDDLIASDARDTVSVLTTLRPLLASGLAFDQLAHRGHADLVFAQDDARAFDLHGGVFGHARRWGGELEIAKAVLFLVADGDYITGQQINVNGGMHM